MISSDTNMRVVGTIATMAGLIGTLFGCQPSQSPSEVVGTSTDPVVPLRNFRVDGHTIPLQSGTSVLGDVTLGVSGAINAPIDVLIEVLEEARRGTRSASGDTYTWATVVIQEQQVRLTATWDGENNSWDLDRRGGTSAWLSIASGSLDSSSSDWVVDFEQLATVTNSPHATGTLTLVKNGPENIATFDDVGPQHPHEITYGQRSRGRFLDWSQQEDLEPGGDLETLAARAQWTTDGVRFDVVEFDGDLNAPETSAECWTEDELAYSEDVDGSSGDVDACVAEGERPLQSPAND